MVRIHAMIITVCSNKLELGLRLTNRGTT